MLLLSAELTVKVKAGFEKWKELQQSERRRPAAVELEAQVGGLVLQPPAIGVVSMRTEAPQAEGTTLVPAALSEWLCGCVAVWLLASAGVQMIAWQGLALEIADEKVNVTAHLYDSVRGRWHFPPAGWACLCVSVLSGHCESARICRGVADVAHQVSFTVFCSAFLTLHRSWTSTSGGWTTS